MNKRATVAAAIGFLALAMPFCGRAETRLINMERGKFMNPSGGLDDSFGTRGGRVKMDVPFEGDNADSLHFDYNVSGEKQDAGHWFALQHFDMRPYQAVRFKVKGRNGGEMIAFGFKDDRWYEDRISLEKYLKEGITQDWQTVEIPLKDFDKVRQWDSMDNFSLSFFNSKNFLPRSEVYVKDVELIPSADPRTDKWYAKKDERQTFPVSFDAKDADTDQMLDAVERSAFGFFWNEANPKNGLIKDRCYAFGADQRRVASIGSVGFGLSSICVADKRGWIPHDAAYERVLTTLKFFSTEAGMYNGFYFHFYEMETGAPSGRSEVSSVDTGIFLYGVLTAKQYYKGTEVENVAQQVLERADWTWMLNGGKTLSMGWFPGNQFIPHRWQDYNEAVLLYFLGVGSPTHALPVSSWDLIDREPVKYGSYEFVAAAGENSLFEHQYPQCWLDLRDRKDKKKINYYQNSILATKANRDWCAENSSKYKTFAQGFWGLTACDGTRGYVINGAPFGHCDGTVAPTATLSSIVFTPDLAADQMRKYFGMKKQLWGKYGFVDAFNLDKEWASSVYIGVDIGPTLLMIENHRTGMIWDLVQKDPMIQEAYAKMGFEKNVQTANLAILQPLR
ncbi:MAG: hypothetical protein JO317_04220 [Verrucomicrobiae bacterium]|nr:hypothetical protein [Verrucomicrobiae bacterium]